MEPLTITSFSSQVASNRRALERAMNKGDKKEVKRLQAEHEALAQQVSEKADPSAVKVAVAELLSKGGREAHKIEKDEAINTAIFLNRVWLILSEREALAA